MTTVVEYRLSWEMPTDHWLIAAIEAEHGKDVWPTYDWDSLGEWKTTTAVFHDGARMDQYNTLKRWAATREQPIRNVVLEQREVIAPDEGWKPA